MDREQGHDRPLPAEQNRDLRAQRLPLILLVGVALAVPLILVLVLVCSLIPAVPWWVGVPLGAVIAAVAVVVAVRRTAETQLRALGARPADPEEHARFHNVVQGLSLAGGIPEPALYVVDDEALNVACVADGDQSAIVATTGLLTALDRIGLEAVMAAAVCRLRSGDAAAATLGAALFGPMLAGPASRLFEPAVAIGFRRLLPTDRELVVDRAAVTLTRYPPGLLAAFTAFRSGTVKTRSSSPASEHLWLVPPSAAEAKPRGVVSPTPLDLRIDVLAEL
jgi:heat shock protein HtpX